MARGTANVAKSMVSEHPQGRRQREADYAARWQDGAWLNQTFTTLDGRRYTLVYQGRPGTGSGPDFRDAVLLAAEGERVCGDVELHLRPGNWRAHGHQRDKRYNGVVLHVVVARGASHEQATPRANGTWAPMIVLPDSDAHSEPRRQLWPCQSLARAIPANDQQTLLRALGEARLHERAAALGAALRQPALVAANAPRWSHADVVLWLALAEALGYGRDRDGMRDAALRIIASPALLMTNEDGEVNSESLGRPGVQEVLIPPPLSCPHPPSPLTLPRGRGSQSCGVPAAGSPSPAHGREAQRVRTPYASTTDNPGGFGSSRLEAQRADGLRRWFARWRADGPWDALEPVLRGGDERAAGTALARALTAAAGGAISPSRAAIVVANVAVPFALAVANRTDDDELARRALEVYAALPGLPSNTITRLLSRQFGLSRLPAGAQAQQGLHHVWARWCREKRCEGCPVASLTSGIKIAATAGS